MVHLRVIVPAPLADDAVRIVSGHPSVVNIVRLAGVSDRPAGDVLLCDVAREDASVVVAQLRGIGIEAEGSIAIEPVETLISDAARRAELSATGSPADAVIWESVEARTSESSELSASYLAFMVIAALIAAIGILEDSQILIIGAMVVGPEFGPLAALCIALVQRRRDLAGRSAVALAVGFPLAVIATFVLTAVLRASDSAPDALGALGHPATLFISDPNRYSVLVALLAGAAGMLSLSTAKSGALVGVLISVTTIPAAANVGVAAAYGDWSEAAGAAGQLCVNLACIVVAGIATLAVQRLLYARRRHRLTGS